MVEVRSPTYLNDGLRGAFFFDEDALKRLEAYAGAVYPGGFTSRYTLRLRDGTEYSACASSEVHQLPLHDVKRRQSFCVQYDTEDHWESFGLSISYANPAFAFATVHSKSEIQAKLNHIVGTLNAQRTWYSFAYGFWAPIVAMIVFNFGVVLLLRGLNQLMPSGGSFAVALLAGAFALLSWNVVRNLLFDSCVVYFGEEARRQDGKRSARRWVFGTLGTGLILAVAAAILRVAIPAS